MNRPEPARSPVVVAKVGGSLLNWPRLPERLGDWLATLLEREQRVVLVAGGGPFADLVRELDRLHGLGDTPSHQLAIQAMDLTAATLAFLVPGLILVDRIDELVGRLSEGPGSPLSTRWRRHPGSERGRLTGSDKQDDGPTNPSPARPRPVPVFAVSNWLANSAESVDLPHSWEVTSDSIAAKLARRLGAGRLVLIKSAPLPPNATLDRAVELGLIDPFFPIASQGLAHVSWLNLRSLESEKPLFGTPSP